MVEKIVYFDKKNFIKVTAVENCYVENPTKQENLYAVEVINLRR